MDRRCGVLAVVAAIVTVALAPATARAAVLQALAGSPHVVGPDARDAAFGRLNGDAVPDAVVSSSGSDSVKVLLGDGAGGFGAAVSYPTGPRPHGLAMLDADGDGDQDVVTANDAVSPSATLSVLLGDGSGSLAAPMHSSRGAGGPSFTAVGHVNGDSDPDLIATNPFFGSVSVLAGGSGATFTATTVATGGNGANTPLLHDLSGDGDPELLVTVFNDGDLVVFPGAAGATFGAATRFDAGAGSLQAAAGDIDGDGRLDVAVGQQFANASTILLGGADSAFTRLPDAIQGGALNDLGDVDGDGELDLAGTGVGSTRLGVRLGGAGATFRGRIVSPVTVNAARRVYTVDLDGDGAREIVVVDAGGHLHVFRWVPTDTTITGGPETTTDDPSPTFELASNSPGSTFECRLDGGDFAACEATFTTPQLSEGAHTLRVRATDPAGYADETPAERTFTVQTPATAPPPPPGPSPATSPPAAPAPPQSAADALRACVNRRLILEDVVRKDGRVQLLGAADRRLSGSSVAIRLLSSNRVVARATIQPDGGFAASAPLPPRRVRNTNRARYRAELGRERSPALKLIRRVIVSSLTSAGGRVVLTGRVVPPLHRPVAPLRLTRRITCSRHAAVVTIRPRSNGRFRISVPAPAGQSAAVYRLSTTVRRVPSRRARFRTFSLPRGVNLRG